MADYYPLIARALTGLDKNTGEARRALYERARTALVAQLRGVEPALSEADITRERLALEEAIRKVEAEAARRPRQEPMEAALPPRRFEPPAAFTPPAPPPPPPIQIREPEPPAREPAYEPPPRRRDVVEPPPPSDWEELRRELDGLAAASQPQGFGESAQEPPEPSPPESHSEERRLPFGDEPPEALPPEEIAAPSERPRRPERKPLRQSSSLVDEGLKGFRDVVAETDDLGEASASAARTAREKREAFAAMQAPSEIERIEPRFGAQDTKPTLPTPAPEVPPPPRPEPRTAARGRPLPPRPSPEEFESAEDHEHQPPLRRGLGGVARKIIGLVVVLLLAVAAFFAYRQWGGNIAGMMQASRTPAPTTQASKEAPPARPKIADRVGGAQQDQTRPSGAPEASVAQRVALFELPRTQQEEAKQFLGSVIWRTETTSPGPGQPADLAVKAEVEIPERHLRMSLLLRRNRDPSLPASHTLEILFSTPADFSGGGVAELGTVQLESTPQGRGEPLAGARVKVTNGFFLVGLAADDVAQQRNLYLLKERGWMNIQLLYNDGQRALLILEKGVPGDRVIEDALKAWGQLPPPQQQ